MPKMESAYAESKIYASRIMEDVSKLLSSKNIEHVHRYGNSEIVISDGSDQTRESIMRLIQTLDIPKNTISILLEVVKVNDIIYIRLRTK